MHQLSRLRSLLAAALVLLAAAAMALAGSPRVAVSSAVAPGLSISGRQFLRADLQGNVYLLRGDTLDVYPVAGDRAAASRRLQASGLVDGSVADAALSADGRSWVLALPSRVLTVQGGRTEATPEVGWLITSVGLLRDAPVAAVLPMSVGPSRPGGRSSVPPLVVRYEGRSWQTRLAGELPRRSREHDPMDALFAEHTVRMVVDGGGQTWLEYPYLGRVERYSPSGRRSLAIVLGRGEARYRGDEDRLRLAFEDRLRGQGFDLARAKTGVFTAELAIRGIAVDRQGVLYMLLDGSLSGGEARLARYDPIRRTLEAVPVALPGGGEVSVAAGKDGAYFAGDQGGAGRWRIGWDALGNAVWRSLPQATIRDN